MTPLLSSLSSPSVRRLLKLFCIAIFAVWQGGAATNTTKPTRVDCTKYYQFAPLTDSLTLYYTSILDKDGSGNGYLRVEMKYAGQGWLGFGISRDGNMVGSEAVIGLPSKRSVRKYNLAGKSVSAVTPMIQAKQTLKNHSIHFDGTYTIVKFTKRLKEDGEIEIDGNGTNTFLYAIGESDVLARHSIQNRIMLTLQNCVHGALADGSNNAPATGSTNTSSQRPLWKAHGFFAFVAWAVLAPLAIGASLLRRFFIHWNMPALWFQLHMGLNLSVFVFTVLAFTFATRAITLESSTEAHFQGNAHRTAGVVIVCFVTIQTLSGLLRPHLPPPPPPPVPVDDMRDMDKTLAKSPQRVRWEWLHRLFGLFLLFLCWWQVQYGLKLYASYYQTKQLTGLFWGIALTLTVAIVIFSLTRFCGL